MASSANLTRPPAQTHRDASAQNGANGSAHPSKKKLARRQKRWDKDVSVQLPALLSRLLASENCADAPPPGHGVYLFSEGGTPMYVGRTGGTERAVATGRGQSSFRTRRVAQTRASHNQGTFAYRLAVAKLAQGKHVFGATRADNCANAAFMAEFKKQCERVKAMEFRVVEIDDDAVAAVFEVYASRLLKTTSSAATS